MKINRDNYEAYFLDFHEGQLSPDMVQEVLMFAELNPDLKEILFEFEEVTLISEQEIVFEKKSVLKKNQIIATRLVNELNFEEFLIGETEGLLDAEQLASLEEFIIKNPQFEKERRLYALAHIPIDSTVVFPAKESLKQKAIPVGKINAETFEIYMARELEGDLTPGEKLQFAEFMQYNPHLLKDQDLYKLTILTPDTSIVFKGKSLLKHSVLPIRRIVYYALSAAASLALMMSVYILFDRKDTPPTLTDNGKVKIEQQIKSPVAVSVDEQITSNEKPNTIQTKSSKGNQVNPSKPQESIEPINQVNSQVALTQHHFIEPLQSKEAQKVKTRNFVDPQFTFIRVSQMYSNQNLEFYYNLKLAEDIQYAQLNSKDANPVRTVLKAATDRTGNIFASKQSNTTSEENKSFSMWTLAELGVKTINNVTSSEMELRLKKDDEGKVVGYDLESGLFNIEKDLKK